MKAIDSHVHIGEYERVKNILENTIYANKYRLYSAINPNVILNTKEYLDSVEGYFAIPIVFKEIDIAKENAFLQKYALNNSNALIVPLIEPNSENVNNLIYKEHFLLHTYEELRSRCNTYDFLNENNGYLLIHCDDKIRKEYINELIKTYPNMNIIIAHMGRNVYEDLEFNKNIIDQFYNKDNVLFDTSTITKTEILKYGISRCGSNRILYGSDFPYEKRIDDSEEKFSRILYMLGLHDNQLENILYKNADEIKRYCKRR